MNTPAPHDFERKSDFFARLDKHRGMIAAYPTPVKRRLAGERRWVKAKRESLVSITTSVGEVLLFGRLD